MEKNEIMQKLNGYKEKLVNMQLKLSKIENNQEYKNEEKFGFSYDDETIWQLYKHAADIFVYRVLSENGYTGWK